jgi:glycosyltransferase involved in cell wall biosynthesis
MQKSASLHVCFLSGSLGRGGAERQLFYMVKALLPLGVTCSVLNLTRGELYEERIRQLGVPVEWIGQSASVLPRLARIVAHIRRRRPDIVQSTHSFMNLYAVVAARITGRMEIGAMRTDFVEEFRQIGRLGYLSAALPRLLMANSIQAIESAKAAGISSKRLCFMQNVVDCDYFQPPENPRQNQRELTVVCVGSLTRQKRHDIFLRSFALARQSNPHLKARLVGEGPLRMELEQLANTLHLSNSVEFAGAVDEMPPVFQRSDILVHTSDYEGTPNVILEAMACGLPVVATNVGAAPDLIVDGRTGLIVEKQDGAALALAIVHLAASPQLREQMGQAARESALEHYSLQVSGPKLQAVYSLLLGRKYSENR